MRLSKKGWNNVLIFGVLLILFIFNFSQQSNLFYNKHQKTVISSNFTILEIETPDYTLTRIGRNWQREPNIGVSSKRQQDIVNNWQKTPLDSLTDPKLPTSDFVFKFFVAEQDQPIIVQLHQLQNNHYILQVDDQLFLSLPAEKISLFLGI